jgi:hypothetical protein
VGMIEIPLVVAPILPLTYNSLVVVSCAKLHIEIIKKEITINPLRIYCIIFAKVQTYISLFNYTEIYYLNE